MIRNSPKGLLFSLSRIRGGNDSESFGDSVAGSHAAGLRAKELGWALKGRCDEKKEKEEEAGGIIEVEDPEVGRVATLMFLVVGMSKGDGWADLFDCATRFPISTKPCGPSSSHYDL